MLLASLGILAALAFVLGLVALAVWALKRYGGARLDARSRVPVEIVQRVPLGPKTGLAVVRVGEKVMAVSIGADGIRPLFELDEADRQRVIATSQVPTPFLSSVDASAAFARFLPGALGKSMGAKQAAAVAVQEARAVSSVAVAEEARTVATPRGPETPAEVPEFLATRTGQAVTYNRSVAPAPMSPPMAMPDRAFRDMLGIAMSGATKLAVFAGVMVLASVSGVARAQVTPPVVPPPVVGAPTTGAATTGAAPAAVTPSAPVVNAPATATSVTADPASVKSAPAPLAKQAKVPTAAAARPAATTTRSGINTSTVNMQLGAAAGEKPAANGRVAPAPTAPVAGGDDALAKLVPQMDIKLGNEKEGGLRLNGTIGIVVMMGLLTLLPTLLLMMTGFTRILIVLHFLKQAMGTQAAPPAQLLAGMALLLTGFVMAPTLTEVNRTAIEPWMAGRITQVEMLKTGVKPMREFMLRQTRESDIKTFIELSKLPRPETADDIPLHVLMSSFVASELRTAFQIGFAIYLPFIVIDAVVASVLMSMGMFMLPPAMISLPFKLLLFVLVDGWSLTISSLLQSFK